MAHSSEVRWADVAAVAVGHSITVLDSLVRAEEAYQDLLEVYAYAGGTDQLLADQLFKEEIAGRSDTQANALEVQKVTDAKNALVAIHQLYMALTNQTITASDRVAPLRRMT